MFGEPADHAAGGGADGDRTQQGRRRQADEDAHAAAPAGPLAPQVVAGVGDVDLAVLVTLDQNDALRSDLLLFDEPHELVEVLLRRLECRVGCQNEVVGVAHKCLLASLRESDPLCRVAAGRPYGRPAQVHFLAGVYSRASMAAA